MSEELPQTTTEALKAEAEIAANAAAIREEGPPLFSSDLFLALYPLLCEPIQPAFIQTVGSTKGKPYESTGIRSVQVQIDRMNAVLTPLGWGYSDEYQLDGKLCKVTVWVGERPTPLLSRSSWGGVQQGSTVGNIYKGSFTNAAKLAFARIGVGHEVYVGATDLDPDVSEAAAEQPVEEAGMINAALAKKLVEAAAAAGESERLQLAASKLAERDVGDCSTEALAIDALTGALTFAQAEALSTWLGEQKAKRDRGKPND